jgi:hypothetical protein
MNAMLEARIVAVRTQRPESSRPGDGAGRARMTFWSQGSRMNVDMMMREGNRVRSRFYCSNKIDQRVLRLNAPVGLAPFYDTPQQFAPGHS